MASDDPLDFTDQTVDELEGILESTDYALEELRTIRDFETAADDPRTTALDAIDEEIDALTSGPDVPGDDQSGDEVDPARIEETYYDGGGATELGTVGVELPDPYSDDAPETLRIDVPVSMAVGGVMFDDDGRFDIEFTMRAKRTLESKTNGSRLARVDPLHPKHGEVE